MTEQSERPSAAAPGDVAETFSLLGHEKRLSILTALHRNHSRSTVAFSTLFGEVDIADSAVFNYHLNELRPEFARKTETGYRLTAAGRRLAQAVAAGRYTTTPELAPFGIDGACYDCGATALRASYRDEKFRIRCTDCGIDVVTVQTPPTVVRGRSPEAALDAFDRWARLEVKQAQAGICPACGGPITPRLSSETCSGLDMEVVASYDCDACGRHVVTTVAAAASEQPVVERFLGTRAAAFEDRRYWELDHYVDDEHVDVLSRNPWRVQVVFAADGDRCRAELDASLDVVGLNIEPDGANEA